MVASVQSSTLWGVQGQQVTVEVHISSGLPGFTIVGQPDGPCREARDRVRAAIVSSGLAWPQTRITVNLAPAELRKVGASLDLPIAVGILVASGVVPPDRVENMGFLGELGLDGTLRRFPGTIPLVDAIESASVTVPSVCARESMLVRSVVNAASHLREVVEALQGLAPWPDAPMSQAAESNAVVADFVDVRGQAMAREAVEIAAAGGHHLLMSGPPGAGKTMLARRLPSLLPPLHREQAIEVVRIQSAAALVVGDRLPTLPPFRAPHHLASAVAMVGGGSASLRPGELSCAQHGVLFLDELGEFSPFVLDALRQPLEEGFIRVERARGSVEFPARFLLVAATNPCPCGWLGTTLGDGPVCSCSPAAQQRYIRRLSGPLLDRFDLRVRVERPDPHEVLGGEPGESTAAIVPRVAAARICARNRGVEHNSLIPDRALDELIPLSRASVALLERHLRRGSITARGVARVRRVARTIADLRSEDPEGPVDVDTVALAVDLRRPVLDQAVAA